MAKPSIPSERRAQVQQMYNELTEWLNYDDHSKHFVRQLLDSDLVKPFFHEYEQHYLEQSEEIAEVDCNELFRHCITTSAFKNTKYIGTHSAAKKKKEGWSALDHATRFAVQVLSFSWANGGEWTCGEFNPGDDETDNEFHQVWAILRYLQFEWEAANLDDWEPDGVTEMLEMMKSSSL
ncbi:hypothetical protein F4780DRAFT_762560 [Xylariomycetidae sp. FL0641]|nr:hypothetical protein F4780DRAFT_762560 [Xylariomycetidae sp. FL0641]